MLAGPSGRYLLIFAASALVTAVLVPLARRAAHRLGMVDEPGSQAYKWHHAPTPLLGGVVIMVAVTLASTVGAEPNAQLFTTLLGAIACGAVGMWDDARGVRPIPKLAIATAGGVALWLVGIQADVTSSVALNFFITILWVAGITQALNIIDNMDGVAIGLAAIGAIGVFAVAGMTGQSRVASLAIATAGAAIGLIPFNYRPNGERATIFLGDAGTLFLGFTLASMTLALDLPGTPTAVRLAIPILMLAVPLFNVGLVVVARIRDGRPIMTGGTDGIAHRVVDLGLSHRTTAIVFWSIGAACAAAGVYVADRVSVELAVVALTVPGAAAVFGIWFFERTQARPGAYRASAAERKTS